MARSRRLPPLLYSTHEITSNGFYQGKQGLVTYIGKTGYTITLFDSNQPLSIPFAAYQGLRTKQVAYPTNPDTGKPYTLAEYRYHYPEYFI